MSKTKPNSKPTLVTNASLSRRMLLSQAVTGAAGLAAAAAIRPANAGKKQKQTIATIEKNTCPANTTSTNRRFSLEYRGVGTAIIKAKSSQGTLGIVVPTVPARRWKAKYTLDLASVDAVDHLIVCPLHNHWDHAKHLQLFAEELLRSGRTAHLIAAAGGRIERHSSGAKAYVERDVLTDLDPAARVFASSLFGGQVRYQLTFIPQGQGGRGHAAHIGSGNSCDSSKRHCGMHLLPSPSDTHCMIGELEVEGERFNFFANDAASAYVADAIPSRFRNGSMKIELALIAIPDSHLAYGYPHDLIRALDPEYVRWIHWEEFIFAPKHSRKRLAKGKPPKTAGQGALPLHVVEEAVEMVPQNCFPEHGHIEYFPKY